MYKRPREEERPYVFVCYDRIRNDVHRQLHSGAIESWMRAFSNYHWPRYNAADAWNRTAANSVCLCLSCCLFSFSSSCVYRGADVTVWEILPHQTTVQSVSRLYTYGRGFFFFSYKRKKPIYDHRANKSKGNLKKKSSSSIQKTRRSSVRWDLECRHNWPLKRSAYLSLSF